MMTAPDDVCAVVLAAGLGTRLRPLTTLLPKALVPVGNVPLLDRALHRLAAAGLSGPGRVAVNAHWLADQVVAHVADRAHAVAEDEPLGTAGALGNLHSWIDGRAVLVLNADAYVAPTEPGDLSNLLDGWDGHRVRMYGIRGTHPHRFLDYNFAGASLLPASDVSVLSDKPAELVLTTWRPAERAGRLDVVPLVGTYLDCGRPADYLAANLHAAAGQNLIAPDATVTGSVQHSVIGARAQVLGSLRRCVLWPDAQVEANEVLTDVIRVGRDLTVPAS